MDYTEPMGWALAHLYHLDHSNAAIHCGEVRYSPITFRLAEALATLNREVSGDEFYGRVPDILRAVLGDLGKYEEDKGR